MRSIILALLLLLPGLSRAQTMAGNISATAASTDRVDVQQNMPFGRDSTGANRRLTVDTSGNLIVAVGGAPTSGSGVSVTALPSFNGSSQTAGSALTYAASALNLTTTVGANVDTVLCYQAMGLGTGVNFVVSTASSAPNLAAGGLGFYASVTMTGQACVGPYKASAGYKLYYQGVGSAAPTLVISVDKVQ